MKFTKVAWHPPSSSMYVTLAQAPAPWAYHDIHIPCALQRPIRRPHPSPAVLGVLESIGEGVRPRALGPWPHRISSKEYFLVLNARSLCHPDRMHCGGEAIAGGGRGQNGGDKAQHHEKWHTILGSENGRRGFPYAASMFVHVRRSLGNLVRNVGYLVKS